MDVLSTAARSAAAILLVATAVTFAARLLRARSRLYSRGKSARDPLSPARALLLALTAVLSAILLVDTARHLDSGSLPSIPTLWLVALAAGHAWYLSEKNAALKHTSTPNAGETDADH